MTWSIPIAISGPSQNYSRGLSGFRRHSRPSPATDHYFSCIADLTTLPEDLPPPIDDGAADHLVGIGVPPVELPAANGDGVRLDQFDTRWLVLYAYPRTGGPDVDLPDDWDLIPGARGCTPQSCAFRDHHAVLRGLDATVWGLSAQPIEEQAEFSDRMHIPFPLLNDRGLQLAGQPLHLPTFEAGGETVYRRLTLIAGHAAIAKVFYPVFPPDRNAADVIDWLRRNETSKSPLLGSLS